MPLLLEKTQRAGVYFFDDFSDMPLIGTQTTQIGFGKYKVFATSGESIAPLSTVNSVELGYGGLSANLANDNESASLAQSYPTLMLSGNTSDSGKLWFECRVACNTLLTATQGFFIGLAETNLFTLATGVPFNASSEVTTNGGSVLGFRKSETGLGVVQSCYNDRATSFTAVNATLGTIAAAYTFMKLGFIYDPYRTTDQIRFFVDGVQDATFISKTTLQATTNLKAHALGLMFANIAAASVSTGKNFLQWWRYAQLAAGS